MWNIKNNNNNKNELTYLQNRNKLTDIEKKFNGYPRGKEGEG